jgi:hypothetical protein
MPLIGAVWVWAAWEGATPGSAACSGAPQLGQNVAPSGTGLPHLGQNKSVGLEYLEGAIYCMRADSTVTVCRKSRKDVREAGHKVATPTPSKPML